MLPYFLAMTLLGAVLLKPLHELTVHHCEISVKNHDKTEISKKANDCPICDLQGIVFTNDFGTYNFQQNVTFFHKSNYGTSEGFYNKIFDKKRGRAPPEFSRISV